MSPFYDLYADHVMHQVWNDFVGYLMRAKWILIVNGGDL